MYGIGSLLPITNVERHRFTVMPFFYIMSFCYGKHLTTRRTYVRLRASPGQAFCLPGFGLAIPNNFSYPLKKDCKKTNCFLQSFLFIPL